MYAAVAIILAIIFLIVWFLTWVVWAMEESFTPERKKKWWAAFPIGLLGSVGWPLVIPVIVLGAFAYGIKQALSFLPKRSKNVGEEPLTEG